MFGFGKQKKDTYQEAHQDDYYYDENDNEGYEEDYGYDSYSDEGYERPTDNYDDYDRGGRRSRRRTAQPVEERYDAKYEEENETFLAPKAEEDYRGSHDSQLQQEVKRLEETVAQLKHQLEVKQSEMAAMATTLAEKDQELQEQQVKADQLEADKKNEIQNLQAEKDHQLQELSQQIDQLKNELKTNQTDQTEALVQAQRQIESLKQTQKENEEMKAELATILIETKKQERAILERAEYEAKGIRSQAEQEAHQVIHDASLELRVMKQEIRNYRKRLRSVQEETTQFFVRLLATSDNLLDDE